MNRGLDGRNPLAYLGVKPTQPTQMVVNKERRPTSTDFQNFQLGTWWIIPTRDSSPTQEVWILINKTATAGTWIELDSGGGSVVPGNNHTLLTADGSGGYGTNVGPGTAGQVLLSGGASANPAFVTPTAGSGLTVTVNASTLEYALDGPFDVADGGTGLTNLTIHNLLIGNNTDPITLLPPDATTGIAVVSQGAGADPAYDTVVVAGGGTGRTSHTAYAVICGGTTSTAAQQSVAGVGTSGQVLTSQGAGMLPTWAASAGVVAVSKQVITSSGTYTPTGGTRYCIVEIVGGGGGAGGSYSTNASVSPFTVMYSVSGAGGAGGYCKSLFDVATVTGESITIGAAGSGGTSSGTTANDGSAGGDTTFGSGGILMTASGGDGGTHAGGASGADLGSRAGGAGGDATGGNMVNVTGAPGGIGLSNVTAIAASNNQILGANGGSTPFGRGGAGSTVAASNFSSYYAGISFDATGYGAGGGSAMCYGVGAERNQAGGNGSAGVCIITEFS